MKMFRTLFLSMVLPISICAQLPQITSLIPQRFTTQSSPTIHRLEIKGNNMWPDFMSITLAGQIMHVHFKKNGVDKVMSRSTIGVYGYSLSFSSPGWTDTPGDIEVYITIDGFDSRPPYRSNSMFVKVDPTSTSAPVINDLSNSTFKTSDTKDKFYLRIYGKNFGEIATTYATIGGQKMSVGWQNLTDGVIDVYLPASVYTTAGTYPVLVHTKYGTSNARNVKIESPSSTMIIKQPVAKTNVPATQIKKVNPSVNTSIKVDDKSKVSATMIQGISVVLSGLIKEAADRAELAYFINELKYVYEVDNQLQLSDNAGNMNISLRSRNISTEEINQIKKQIQEKLNSMKLTASIAAD